MIFLFSTLLYATETTDLKGYWKSESGLKVLIPFMRDGKMPIVFMNGKPLVMVGDWDWSTQSLDVSNSHFSMKGDKLVMTTPKKTEEFNQIRPLSPEEYDGVWFVEGSGEFIPVNDGRRSWVVHIPLSQQATISKAKWKDSDQYLRFRWKGRCFQDFTYEQLEPDLTWLFCQTYEKEMLRIETATPFETTDWSGKWNSFSDWTLYIEMNEQHFERVYLESDSTIIDLDASWVSSSNGRKVQLDRKKGSSAQGLVDPLNPDTFIFRMEGEEILFERTLGEE